VNPPKPARRPFHSVLFLGLAVLTVAVVATAALGWTLGRLYEQPGPHREARTVLIPPGAGPTRIAQILVDAGVLQRPWLFQAAGRLSGSAKRLKAGEYLIPAALNMHGLLDLLVEGRTLQRRLTLPEGATAVEAWRMLAATEGLEGALLTRPAEGTLLPETYFFSYGDRRMAVIERMQEAMRETVARVWQDRAEGLPLRSPEEMVVLASIVEKETSVEEERPRVAAVFLNRLRRGMRLQADPTVVYALTGGDPTLARPLTRADLGMASRYNTYVSDGLPPGPIANPGRMSLLAVARPMQSDELYFVANGQGGHAFARTLEEHQRNVARWRATSGRVD